VELDVLAKDFDWSNLLSVHRTEHVQSEEDESSDTRDSTGSIEVCYSLSSHSLGNASCHR